MSTAAHGARAFCNWDEDAITMAVEASRACLSGSARGGVHRLKLASTRFPYEDLQNASLVAAALNLRPDLEVTDYANAQRASTAGLIDAMGRRDGGSTLYVAADAPAAAPGSDQELQYGAGAAALLLGEGDVCARFLGASSTAVPFVDHFRAHGEDTDYYWEERWIRDEGYLKLVPAAVTPLLARQQLGAGDIHHFVLAAPGSGVAPAVARKIGLRAESVVDSLASSCGYAGAAHPILMLSVALERAQPGDRILLVGFGQGCDALLFQATEHAPRIAQLTRIANALAAGNVEASYMRFLSFGGVVNYAWGMRAEKDAKTALTQQYRAAAQVFGFVGGRCGKCHTVQFPRLGKCVNPSCRASGPLQDYPLADEPARVLTHTSDWLQYSPAPPFNFGLIQFDNGARLLMEIVDVDSDQLRVGLQVRMVFRIKERDRMRHYDRYFWKATPAAIG